MILVRSLLVVSIALFTTARQVASQVPGDASVQVDRIFARWDSVNSPGCAVGVAEHGLVIFSRAYGMADLEHNVPNTPSTIFEGGSLSKQFTAAAIMLLVLDGKLSLDDDVRKYVPEVPDYGVTITLRHLLTHTSGLRDWGSVAEISGWGRQSRTHTHAHVLDIVSRQSALNFTPGHEYSYCNTGYNLLAIIVGRVSGMSFAEYSRQRIFEPLGLANTQWRDDYTRIVKRRSTAYAVRDTNVSIMRPIEDVHGNGGILTTVGDLLIWNQALTDGRLGGPEFLRMMHDQGQLNDGRQISYAAGLVVQPYAGVPSITHTGSTSGYRAFLGRYPEQGLSVAMLCNASNVSTSGAGGLIAQVFLGDALQDPVAPAEVPLSPEVLSRLVGLYRDTQTGDPMHLALEEGRLQMNGRVPLLPLSQTEFQVGMGDRRFVFQAAGERRPSIVVRSGEFEDGTYEPVDEFRPTAADLGAYQGEYYSEDAETLFAVEVENDSLVVLRRPDTAFRLLPVYSDGFDAPRLGFIRFERDGAGRVVELRLRQSRVYDMRFQRVEQ